MLSSTAHADFEIRILNRMPAPPPAPANTFAYEVELTLDHAQECSGLANLDDLLPWSGGAETKEAYGLRLFNLLLPPGSLRDGWNRMSGQSPLRRVRLRINPQLARLHPIQWELLRVPDDGVGVEIALRTDTPFSRYLPQDRQPGRAIVSRPIRVLVAVANPAGLKSFGLAEVDAKAEFASLINATAGIKDADGRSAIQFDLLEAPCTLDNIRDRLNTGYHVLHFVGHGVFAAATPKAPEGAALLLPSATGEATPVADTAVAAMIGNHLAGTAANPDPLRLVFLESCETARRSANDAFRGLAPKLVEAGVAAVIAMQDLIEVKTARPFAATFYRQLLRHGLVDLACNEARGAVKAQKLRGADVPVLFMRLRSGELFRVEGEIRGDGQATFWTRLLNRIARNTCIPFLGPRVNRGILPSPETIAVELAVGNGYRLADRDNLARVAQFEAFKDPEAFRATFLDVIKQSLCRTVGSAAALDQKSRAQKSLSSLVRDIGWETLTGGIDELRIYDQLAALDLPIYITSNVDPFMFEALRHRHAANRDRVHRIGPRWRKTTEGALTHSLLNPEPSNDTPYVLHLNGFDDEQEPSQLDDIALSEDDMMAAFVRLARDQAEILPSNILTPLANSSWMFIGYNLQDWEFRLALLGLLQPIARADAKNRLHVGVQFDSAASAGGLSEADVQKYLQDYLGKRFNITVYWGTPGQFVSELYERFTK